MALTTAQYFMQLCGDDTALSLLLMDQTYSYPYVDGSSFIRSIVADLPPTLLNLHISSMSELPFDPMTPLDNNY